MKTPRFFREPILNSPYEYPGRHWILDQHHRPTGEIKDERRAWDGYLSPIPPPRKRTTQGELAWDSAAEAPQYDANTLIPTVRSAVDAWRQQPEAAWGVTPETARLLRHWRHHDFSDIRPFFCQVEAAEMVIWLTEVAPTIGAVGPQIRKQLGAANEDANPGLERIALKLATGAGKTTVMAMLIAWQTVNAVRRPGSRRFTRGFLVVAPGVTVRDRLRVLQPNDPDAYYARRELVPREMLRDLQQARIVITNYHAFVLRETQPLSKGGRALLQGHGPDLRTRESAGQMLQRVMPSLMGNKRVLVLNDEAHHCYRSKPSGEGREGRLKGDDRREAEKNREAARVWISGLDAVRGKLDLLGVIDLSATPFFLRGSGYPEGALFPWTVSDFSLMDAIESGIVKLPRVPVADDTGADKPRFRNLWDHIGKKLPRKGRTKGVSLDPFSLPTDLTAALDALYGHYERTFETWERAGVEVPPCLIVVCHNTAASKLVYDYIAGFERQHADGSTSVVPGRFELFRNFQEDGTPLARPRTLLIDSEQLDAGEALDRDFRAAASDEIERFRRELLERGERRRAESLSDEDLLREAMNTVGVAGRLGGQTRCVVSVSMLTEGWDARTVTHVLGVRAFGTQLLCEQVVGRSLRRQSYALNADGRFDPEYADVLGIPFDFAAEPVVAPVQSPRETVLVKAMRPERDAYEIRFPRVAGYRVELPEDRLTATFDADATFELDPGLLSASIVRNEGVVGLPVDLTAEHLGAMRQATLIYHLTRALLNSPQWRDRNGEPKLYLFGQLKRIVRQWLAEGHLVVTGRMQPAQVLYPEAAAEACRRITAGVIRSKVGEGRRIVSALLDPYNPAGSTADVHFTTSRKTRWQTAADRCHVNWAVYDSDWEAEFCRIAERHPRVRAYVKNHSLGLEIPYRFKADARRYIPDFIVLVDDGQGDDDPLHLLVEIKGARREDAKAKATTTQTCWVPGVNRLRSYGRWDFIELRDVARMQADFAAHVTRRVRRAPAEEDGER